MIKCLLSAYFFMDELAIENTKKGWELGMTFGNIYNRLSAIFGTLLVLLILWMILLGVAPRLTGLLPGYIGSPVLLVIVILGIYLSYKIVRWSNTPTAEKSEVKKGTTLFNTLATMPSPVLTVLGLILIWIILLLIVGAITNFLTGIAQILADIVGIAVGCYLSYIYLKWLMARWKRRAAQP